MILNFGAGDEARTRYLDLGKVALYQMSYTRIFNRHLSATCYIIHDTFLNVNTFLKKFCEKMRTEIGAHFLLFFKLGNGNDLACFLGIKGKGNRIPHVKDDRPLIGGNTQRIGG